MTELDSYEGEVETYATPSTKGLQRLRAEVEAMKDAATMARGMAAGGFIPDHWMRDKNSEQAVAAMAAAILYGAELGLSAMKSLNELFIVRGKPAMYSRTMAGLVRSAGYVLEPVEESDTKCVWRAYRDGSWKYSEWTMERAVLAGYTSNKLYQTEPQAMLRAKCITEVCRIAFQDVLLGLDYSMEELDLIDGVQVQRAVKKPGSRGMAALREIASEDAPPTAGDNTPPPVEVADQPEPELPLGGEGVTNEQVNDIKVLCKARGLTGKGILDDVSQYMGQTVTTLNDLSSEDAAAYISSMA